MSEESVISVLVADDDEAMRALLDAVLGSEPGIHLAGVASTADECLDLARDLAPDVAVVDAHMPGGGGLRVCRQMGTVSPRTSVLVLSGSGDVPLIIDMLRAGAVGYVIKGDMRVLTDGVRRAARGESTLPDELATTVLGELRRQSSSEAEDAGRLYGEALDAIIEQRLFSVHFQPIVDVIDRRVVAAEALARFADAPPDVWFERARAVSRGEELELLTAFAALDLQARLPPDVSLCVNVSPDTMLRSELGERLSSATGPVILELTEHIEIRHPALFNQAVAALRALGVRLAADDTGAGFANLTHLVQLAPEILKLDRALVKDIDKSAIKQALAHSLVGFTQAVGADLIAEGVETRSEHETLRQMGVRYVQGFLFGRPAPLPLATIAW